MEGFTVGARMTTGPVGEVAALGLTLNQSRKETVALQGETAAAYRMRRWRWGKGGQEKGRCCRMCTQVGETRTKAGPRQPRTACLMHGCISDRRQPSNTHQPRHPTPTRGSAKGATLATQACKPQQAHLPQLAAPPRAAPPAHPAAAPGTGWRPGSTQLPALRRAAPSSAPAAAAPPPAPASARAHGLPPHRRRHRARATAHAAAAAARVPAPCPAPGSRHCCGRRHRLRRGPGRRCRRRARATARARAGRASRRRGRGRGPPRRCPLCAHTGVHGVGWLVAQQAAGQHLAAARSASSGATGSSSRSCSPISLPLSAGEARPPVVAWSPSVVAWNPPVVAVRLC